MVVDPFISSHTTAGDRFTYVDLPDHLDYCLITHGHQDHVVLESLLQIRRGSGWWSCPATAAATGRILPSGCARARRVHRQGGGRLDDRVL